jgi:hypothetical protein
VPAVALGHPGLGDGRATGRDHARLRLVRRAGAVQPVGHSRGGSYSSLLPGDALVRRSGGSGHIVLFLGWNDAAHSAACVLEEASTASDMQFRARTKSSLTASGFKAVRADRLGSSGATSAAVGDDPSPDSPDTSGTSGAVDKPDAADDTGGGGQACTSSGDCNPGGDGAGLICIAGKCRPGCTSNAQCPGVTSCIGGQCR